MASIQSLETSVILGTQQSIRFSCQSCSSSTEIYLATACDTAASSSVAAIPGSRTASVGLQGGQGTWEALLDASVLQGGRDYRLCVDQA